MHRENMLSNSCKKSQRKPISRKSCTNATVERTSNKRWDTEEEGGEDARLRVLRSRAYWNKYAWFNGMLV